jgi:hypothetical protein
LHPQQAPSEPSINAEEFETIPIAVGAKIRLRRNLDLNVRIAYGSVGIVEGIVFDP